MKLTRGLLTFLRFMKKRKKSITLIEIMIVILLIGLIGGALAFNMRGSIDEGKAFKTEQNISRLQDILMLEYAKGDISLNEIKNNYVDIVKSSPLGKGNSLLKGGWNEDLIVSVDEEREEIKIVSQKLNEYRNKKKS